MRCTTSSFAAALLGLVVVQLPAAAQPAVPVPPSLELEILDPSVEPHGNPGVLVTPGDPLTGTRAVEIPPAVIVHRFYYTGDRSFQAPLLPGGPSIIVAHHPCTGERVYVPAQLLPGAPRIVYCDDRIVYDYGERCIEVRFSRTKTARIVYVNGPSLPTRVVRTTGAVVEGTGIPKVARAVGRTAVSKTRAVGGFVVDKVEQVLEPLPLLDVLTTSEEERAAEELERARRRVIKRRIDVDATRSTLR